MRAERRRRGDELSPGVEPENLQGLLTWRLRDLWVQYGFSMQDAANRATAAGFPITKQRLSQLKNAEGIGQVPYARTLRAIAIGLDLPVERVKDAANRSAGNPTRPRRYLTGDQAAVRRMCVDCSNPSGTLDKLVLVLPYEGLTAGLTEAEIHELRTVVEQTVTRQLARRGNLVESPDHSDVH